VRRRRRRKEKALRRLETVTGDLHGTDPPAEVRSSIPINVTLNSTVSDRLWFQTPQGTEKTI
jgi:hypothetical protein